MVKDKYVWLVALFVASYITWVAVSGFLASATMFSGSIHDQKVTRMQGISAVDSLIVGGSNAVYSLSAERLSELSGETWFNGALPREGFTRENMAAFVDDFINSVDADNVSTVLISSNRHWHVDRRDSSAEPESTPQPQSKQELGFDGIRDSPFWLPSKSLWDFVSGPPAKVFPTIISGQGDLLHDATDLCRPNLRSVPTEWGTDRDIDVLLETWLPLVHSRFPDAAIVITIPSRYTADPVDPAASGDYLERLQSKIEAWIGAQPDSDGIQVSTVLETNYDDPSLLCTTGPHYNATGRLLRTDALYEKLIEIGVKNGR